MAESKQLSTETQSGVPSGAVEPTSDGRIFMRIRGRAIRTRELLLLGGLALVLGLTAAIFLWAQQPDYRTLYSDLDEGDQADVVEHLRDAGVEVRINQETGVVEVPARDLYESRMLLASEGLPESEGAGYEILGEDQRFGTSRFREEARFERAMEEEIARSIRSLSAVEAARVHLAIPEDSVFVRESNEPKASVTLQLRGSRSLSDQQIAGIVHMVSSAVPELSEDRVSVVDGDGALLTKESDGGNDRSLEQFDYRSNIESAYQDRIEHLLAPLVGEDRARASVSANIDFSREQTQEEIFDPDGQVLRSEQFTESIIETDPAAIGVPGALTNQPPGDGAIVGNGGEPGPDDDGDGEGETSWTTDEGATRNYEISRAINTIEHASGVIDGLSVAVVVDQPRIENDEGEMVPEPMEADAIDRIENLVIDGLGLDQERGDTVSVVDTAFQDIAEDEGTMGEMSLWEQPWFMEIIRYVIATIVALALILFIARPMLRALLAGNQAKASDAIEPPEGGQLPAPEADDHGHGQSAMSMNPDEVSEKVEAARDITTQDPVLSANVVKSWLNDE